MASQDQTTRPPSSLRQLGYTNSTCNYTPTVLSVAKDFQLQSFHSTNGTTWNNYENSEVNLAYTNGVEELWLNGMVQVAANSYLKVQILNISGADIVFNTGGQWSYMHVYRVG